MSNLELEQAAMAPCRWIGAVKKQHPSDPDTILCPRTTRVIKQFANSFVFLVPGGRYLVNAASEGLFVWDLGYVSTADCRIIASVRLEADFAFCMVQTTRDGMGLLVVLPDM